MKTRTCIAILSFIVWGLSSSAWGMFASTGATLPISTETSQGIHVSVGASMTIGTGDMTYTIKQEGILKSELEWPMDGIVYVGGVASVRLLDRFQLNAGLWKSLNEDSGTMKDSDWFYRLYGDTRAVYSESDATLDGTRFDLNLRYAFLQTERMEMAAVVGYAYTKWEWEARDGYQTGILPSYTGVFEGLGITYEEEIALPYLGLTIDLFPGPPTFGINFHARYSPIAQCDDIDDHVLRFKRSTGDTEGTFLAIGSAITWNLTPAWSLVASVDYERYDLDGEQDQYFYGGNSMGQRYNDIDLTVEGNQFAMGLMLRYEF